MIDKIKVAIGCVVLAFTFLSQAFAAEATISASEKHVTFVNLLKPQEGVSVAELARQLTVAMQNDASKMPGFHSASVHISLDNSYVLNYAQWDSAAAVDRVVAALGEGKLPDLARAFSMASAEFHPYDVFSVTVPGH